MPTMTPMGLGSAALEEQREALAVYVIQQLQGLIATTKDDKVKLAAVAELNKILALGAYKSSGLKEAKQTNNFFGTSPAAAAGQALSSEERIRLQLSRTAAAASAAAEATTAEMETLETLTVIAEGGLSDDD